MLRSMTPETTAYMFTIQPTQIKDSKIGNSVTDGISIMNNSHNAVVTNNEVTNSGNIGKKGKNSKGAIRIYRSNYSTIQNNKVTNSGYNGIDFNYSTGHLIKNNIVENSCLILADGGGIYTWGVDSTNSSIIGNMVISSVGGYEGDGDKYKNMAQGIYLDDAVSYMTVEGNTVIDADHGIIIKGKNHVISNNTLFKLRASAYKTTHRNNKIHDYNHLPKTTP